MNNFYNLKLIKPGKEYINLWHYGISELAGSIGIDKEKIKQCIKSGKYTKKVISHFREGSERFNVIGTPGNVLINNKTGKWTILPGAYPYEIFKEKIDELLE